MSKTERGLMIGRYQPFHNGHLELVQQAMSECEEIIIAIAASQFNYTPSNPFTAGERTYMIHEALVAKKIDMNKVYIIPIMNLENNAIWLGHVKSNVPEFDTIYTGNKFVKELAEQGGAIKIRIPVFLHKKTLNATNIRSRIVNDKSWKNLVPESIYQIINDIMGVSRIKMLFETQKSNKVSESQYKTNYYPNIR